VALVVAEFMRKSERRLLNVHAQKKLVKLKAQRNTRKNKSATMANPCSPYGPMRILDVAGHIDPSS